MIKARVRFPGRTLGAMLIGLIFVVATAGLSGASTPGQGGSKGSLTMGSKNLPGAQVLGQVYGQALASAATQTRSCPGPSSAKSASGRSCRGVRGPRWRA